MAGGWQAGGTDAQYVAGHCSIAAAQSRGAAPKAHRSHGAAQHAAARQGRHHRRCTHLPHAVAAVLQRRRLLLVLLLRLRGGHAAGAKAAERAAAGSGGAKGGARGACCQQAPQRNAAQLGAGWRRGGAIQACHIKALEQGARGGGGGGCRRLGGRRLLAVGIQRCCKHAGIGQILLLLQQQVGVGSLLLGGRLQPILQGSRRGRCRRRCRQGRSEAAAGGASRGRWRSWRRRGRLQLQRCLRHCSPPGRRPTRRRRPPSGRQRSCRPQRQSPGDSEEVGVGQMGCSAGKWPPRNARPLLPATGAAMGPPLAPTLFNISPAHSPGLAPG